MTGLYEEETFFEVLFVTGILGGMAAWATGRAIAETWRPYHQLVIYMVLLGAAVRFAHFVLFEGALFSIPSYFADMLYLLAIGSIAFRVTLVRRMTAQYHWLYERTSWLTWRDRVPPADNQGIATPKE